jgi:NADPH:quinone reductase-like Zn-dependent oxidoreductase
MIAVRVHRYGGPEELVLEETAIPVPSPGETLVRVSAAGVGPWDALIRTGRSGVAQRLPLTPGSDIAGVVQSTGEPVFGVTNRSFTGGYAQCAAASMGSIARWAGARVIAVAAAGDAGYLRGLGAAEIIDFHTQGFDELVAGVDAVIDTVGGDAQARSFSVIKPGGMLVSSVSQPSEALATQYGVRTVYFIVDAPTAQRERIARLIDDGTLKVDLGVVLSLADARKAHEMLAGTLPHPRGKIVLDVEMIGEDA